MGFRLTIVRFVVVWCRWVAVRFPRRANWLLLSRPQAGMKVLYQKQPRALALSGDSHGLVIRAVDNARDSTQPVVVVDVVPNSQITKDQGWRPLLRHEVYGCLGLIQVEDEIFMAVVTGAIKGVALPVPYETVDRIYLVEFACVTNDKWDFWDIATGGATTGSNSANDVIDHPCSDMQKLLSNGLFYFSNDFDLTLRLQTRGIDKTKFHLKLEHPANSMTTTMAPDFMWNHFMMKELLKFRGNMDEDTQQILSDNRFLTLAIRGFAKTVRLSGITMTIISKQLWRRAGTRFNARGIDDAGNVANFVETEYIMASDQLIYSYTQIRGSVPAFWEQDSTLINPKITVHRSVEASQGAFNLHFEKIIDTYGICHIVNLLSFTKLAEVQVLDRFRKLLKHCLLFDELEYTEWDFHAETKQQGFAAATRILPLLKQLMKQFGWYEWDIHLGKTITSQDGIFRTNCLDCLDRTNLIQQVILLAVVDVFLREMGLRHSAQELQPRHNNLWADNGDAISMIYTGTNALKLSFTRLGKMNLAGALSDVTKSVLRMYQNTFVDGKRQQTMDTMLGVDRSSRKVRIYDPMLEFVAAKLDGVLSRFTSYRDVNIFTGTYNLNGKEPERADLRAWLFPPEQAGVEPEIYGIGLQEIIELNAGVVFSGDNVRAAKWARIIGDQLGSKYVLLRTELIALMAIFLFVKQLEVDQVTQVAGGSKKTGLGGMTANKGGCAVRFKYGATLFALLTSHLAAGTAATLERYNDFLTIFKGLRFTRNYTISDHDHILWFGDLNYRIDLPNIECRGLVDVGAWDELIREDQLCREMAHKGAFYGFLEGQIKFFPTYKFDKGTSNYDTLEKQRVPSWTDRVLWLSPKKYGKKHDIENTFYNLVMDIFISDHKPVYGGFKVRCAFIDDKVKLELRKKYTSEWKLSHAPIGVQDLVDFGGASDLALVSSQFTNDALMDMNLPINSATTSPGPPPPPPRQVGLAPVRKLPPDLLSVTPLSPARSPARSLSPLATNAPTTTNASTNTDTANPPPPPPRRLPPAGSAILFNSAPLVPANSSLPSPRPQTPTATNTASDKATTAATGSPKVVSPQEPAKVSPKAPLKPKKPDALHGDKLHKEAEPTEQPALTNGNKTQAPPPPAPRNAAPQKTMLDWQPLVPK